MLTGATLIPDNPQNAVILLHGYGSNGNDLISLGEEWQSLLPETAFFAPNAPTQIFYDGYEWFSLNDFQPDRAVTPDYLQTLSDRANKTVPEVILYLNEISKQYNIPFSNFVLAGFSQGGLLALNTAFSLTDSVRAVVGMSAVPLIQPIPTDKRLNIMLTHGQMDDVVLFEAMNMSKQTLTQMNQSVKTCVRPNMSHGIDFACVHEVGQFIRNALNAQKIQA